MNNNIARWEEVILEQTKSTDELMDESMEDESVPELDIGYGYYHPTLEPKQVDRYRGRCILKSFVDIEANITRAFPYAQHLSRKSIFAIECDRLEKSFTFLGVKTQKIQEYLEEKDIPYVHCTVKNEEVNLAHFYRCGPNIKDGFYKRKSKLNNRFILCKHPTFEEKYYIVHLYEDIQLPSLMMTNVPTDRLTAFRQMVQIVWPFMFCQLKLAIQTHLSPDLWLPITYFIYLLYCREASFEHSQCKKDIFTFWTKEDRSMEEKFYQTMNNAMMRVGQRVVNPTLPNFYD